MDSQRYGGQVILSLTETRELMIENRQLKSELASVKYELVQATLQYENMPQLYSLSTLKFNEIVEKNRRLNEILSNVQSQLASLGRLITRKKIHSGPSLGMAYTTGREGESLTQASSHVGGRRDLKRNGEARIHDGAHPNPNANARDERNQRNSNPSRTSREITVSRGLAVADNTQSIFDEAWKSLAQGEKEWSAQPEVKTESDGEIDWLYETLNDMAPTDLLIDEESKANWFGEEVVSLEWEEVHWQDPAKASLTKSSTDAFESGAAIELVAPPLKISFECYLCKKSFAKKYNLSSHFRGHTGEKLFHCEYQPCGKSFVQKQNLVKHKRTHTGEKPFICQYPDCGKGFAQNIHLSRHQRLHNGEKPYVCNRVGCASNFRWNYQLEAHIRASHSI